MRRFLRFFIPVFLLGFVAGNAFWYLASPLWINREVSERLTVTEGLTVVSKGTFRDVDMLHRGSGTATVYRRADGSAFVRMTEFRVTNGPALEVWLVTAPDPKADGDVTGGDWLSLGPLKGNIGDQNYDIPDGTDLGRYGSVVIWCEQFGVLFSPAPLVTG